MKLKGIEHIIVALFIMDIFMCFQESLKVFEPIIKVNLEEDDYLWAVDEKMPWFPHDSYG